MLIAIKFQKMESQLGNKGLHIFSFNISYLNVQCNHFFDQNYMNFINLLMVICLELGIEGKKDFNRQNHDYAV